MDKENGQPPDLSSHAVRWDAYRLRESFSLFELACLVHRLDPKAVNDDAVTAVKRHGGPLASALERDSLGAVAVMYASPAMYFIPPVGDTLEAMKLATSPTIGYSVKKDRARQIAQGLGYQWPVELEHHAPAPVVAAPAEKRRVFKKKALIHELQGEWPTIEQDLSEASRNGLDAAKAEGHGNWDAQKARDWAESKGKLVKSADVHTLPSVWLGPVTRHRAS